MAFNVQSGIGGALSAPAGKRAARRRAKRRIHERNVRRGQSLTARGKSKSGRTPSLLMRGRGTNRVASGAGSARKGQDFRVAYDAAKGRWVHVYGHGPKARKVTIRQGNPLAKQYQTQYGGKRKGKRGSLGVPAGRAGL